MFVNTLPRVEAKSGIDDSIESGEEFDSGCVS